MSSGRGLRFPTYLAETLIIDWLCFVLLVSNLVSTDPNLNVCV